ncbi:MAG: chemotaxis protein CheC, partial [Promethearchaeota archaeon]
QYQQDILKELGNIGSGNAVTALSRLIKKKIDVNLTDVGIISFDKMSKQFGNSSQQVCGIFSNIDKPSKSTILQIFEMKPLLSLIASMTGKKSKIDPNKVKNKKDLDKFAVSTITEMGNIMAGHYASALGDLTGIKLMIDVPEFTMSTVGALGNFLSSELKTISEYVLIIKTMINIVDSKLSGIFIFIPDIETLEIFFKKLGLSQGPLVKGKKPTQKIPKFDLSKIKLSTTQKDALMEVGNIGAGNAANALAKMINKRVDINIPSVEMVELDVFAKKLSKKKEKMLVAWSNVTGTARATVLTMFSVKDILKISSIIIEDTQKKKLEADNINSITDLPEFYRSAISELGHILASHYTTALGDLLMIRMMTEAPDMSIDKDQQLFNILKDEIGLLKELSLVITTNVLIKDIRIVGTFLFIPDINTLHELLDALSKFFE